MKKGLFVISLDFELLWGVFDVVNFETSKDYFNQTRIAIPKILSLFKEHEIHCTWAIVGMLFNKDKKEWLENKPEELPSYTDPSLSAYSFADEHMNTTNQHEFFAPELIKMIIDSDYQEIATHTYSHYYCQEPGQSPDQFREDLQQAIKIAAKWNVKLSSLVFPRNQLNDDYLKICRNLGITSVRSNPDDWYWSKTSDNGLMTKLARTGDAYIPLGNKAYTLDRTNESDLFPMQQKASRFFRPLESNAILRKLKLRRIKGEMLSAAKNKEIYHLWWHPHNFGSNPEESLKDLEYLIDYYLELNKLYDFQSRTMEEVSKLKD